MVRDSWRVVRGSLCQHALNAASDGVVRRESTRSVQQNSKFAPVVSVFRRVGQISQCAAKRKFITVFQFPFHTGKFKYLVEHFLGLILIARGLRTVGTPQHTRHFKGFRIEPLSLDSDSQGQRIILHHV